MIPITVPVTLSTVETTIPVSFGSSMTEYPVGFDSAITVVGSSSDYEILLNKPQIEGIELIGNRLLPEIGIGTLTNAEIEEMLTLANLT